MSEDVVTLEVPEGLVIPRNPDGSKRRGARFAKGESIMTGSAQTRKSQDAYIEWLVAPREAREPKTKTEVAEWLGVTPKTLRNWEKDTRVMRLVSQRTKNNAKIQNASSILEALYKTATDTESSRQVAAAKVYLDYVEEKVEEISAEDLKDIPPEELAQMLADLHDLVLEDRDGN